MTVRIRYQSVVVIIGTGAGGGTLANELAQKGIDVVALEAGGRHLPQDYINDEWASFGQLAWTDMRTTSGSWRVATDFANLPAWIVKAVGGSTVHWAGASLHIQDHEFRALSEYGAHVQVIEHDDDGKVSAVVYMDAEGKQQRQMARAVCVAGNSIESPRLLLNSASNLYADGLANSSGQVGRNYMRHMTGSVYGSFENPVHMYRGTTMAGIISDEARLDTSRGFVGGYELETLALGVPFMAAFLNPGAWGREFASSMDQYSHMAGMWIVGEDMPQEDNRITLSEAKDQFGLPVANVHFDDHPNDVAMRTHAYRQGMALYDSVGATQTYPTPPYPSTHNLGTNRMSSNAADGVVNSFGQSHDIVNLFVSDGSVFTTGGAENPTLTIVSLAIRQADRMAELMTTKVF